MQGRWEVTDEQWAILEPLLRFPRRADGRGRPPQDTSGRRLHRRQFRQREKGGFAVGPTKRGKGTKIMRPTRLECVLFETLDVARALRDSAMCAVQIISSMVPKRSINPKRRIRANVDSAKLADLATHVVYIGSPYHKRNPGDFGLTPPAEPREDKTLCDGVHIFQRDDAQQLLRDGVLHGLVSVQERGSLGFPQNIWAVSAANLPLEAQLDNEISGTYHGYPMQRSDPLAGEVLRRWTQAADG